jgi:tetratricopeptide (TPR) repeat protein
MTSPTTVPLPRPRHPRLAGFVLATAAIVAGSYLVAAPSSEPPTRERPSRAAPTPMVLDGGAIDTADVPAAPIAPIPSGSIAHIDRSIAAWSKNLAANDHDYLAATNLALLYHGRGRLSGDLADQERALDASRRALAIAPDHAPARALEASALFTLHDFAAAYAAADALVTADATQLGALATRFDAAIELGRIDGARADLERLMRVGGAAVLVREARLASVTGDPLGALRLARAARSAAAEAEADDLGFYAYAVGEYARLAGDARTARAAFRDALAARPNDVGALVGLARIDAFEGRPDAAIEGLRAATAVVPQPEALALLGDLLVAGGSPGADRPYETVRFIGRLGDAQAATFDRQLLRFELDHGGADPALLERARASLAARPDWTGHDAVAWASYRLGRLDEAAAEIAAARALGADDARLRFHAGAIALALGDTARGREQLTAALGLGPALDPIERAEAERLLGG